MSSNSGWPQEYMTNPRVMQAHEAFVDMFTGRTPFNLLDALSLSIGLSDVDLDQNVSDSSEGECDRSLQPYCGLSRNFLQRSRPRVAVVAARTITREAVKKAEKTAEELIEEEERIKKKAEKKRLKKLRQKEKKRLEKQGKENADSKQNKGEGIKKNQNKKSAESPLDAGPQCNSGSSSEEEDEDDAICSEKECLEMKKQLQKQEKKKSNKTNDKQTLNSNEDVSIKKKNLNKSLAESHPDKSPESSSDVDEDDGGDEEKDHVHSDVEELDMSSCFVSNAAAAIVKRKLEKAKEKKEKKDRRAVDSGKDSHKPSTEEQQNSKVHPKVVTPLATQNQVKADPEANVADLVVRSMELAYIGNQYAASGNLEMAVKYFTDAIMHNPREYKLFGNRSFCFEKMKQYEKSLMDANVALSMNPQWIKGLYRKGRALTGLKRYMEAMLVYKEVLTLDSSCTDAAQELINVQIQQLMEMGFTKEQSTNAMIIHGSIDKALEALSGLRGSCIPVSQPPGRDDWVQVEKRSQSPKPAPANVQLPIPRIQPQLQAPPQPQPVKQELFPVWVGCPVPSLTEAFFYDLFNQIGPVHSVKFLRSKGCAFVNYIRKEDSEKAIKKLHGHIVAGGIPLIVRFPDRKHPHLGVSKAATYECKDMAASLKKDPEGVKDEARLDEVVNSQMNVIFGEVQAATRTKTASTDTSRRTRASTVTNLNSPRIARPSYAFPSK